MLRVNSVLAAGSFLTSTGLLAASIIIKPSGEIHYSVISVVLILLTYSAAMVDVKINFRKFNLKNKQR